MQDFLIYLKNSTFMSLFDQSVFLYDIRGWLVFNLTIRITSFDIDSICPVGCTKCVQAGQKKEAAKCLRWCKAQTTLRLHFTAALNPIWLCERIQQLCWSLCGVWVDAICVRVSGCSCACCRSVGCHLVWCVGVKFCENRSC
jgi:hypothetical protein